ncbi:hypothetical protein DACRYDRAFT_109802 [Dacryopinax primogenitus]|uniref:Uncharacterized protein n=1 Tax=Dacryopinax primogenitus (strain DJM 731) TaxID=1858805 RepID=M5G1J2_DACPD|nr:uncharacterized protein DACRYDRAFT_109802 [Dacryopinax primogenitus]EJT99696.1 hypothetical protein DACRYDRAFT_109802 [Dacryopinax primogenitus]
MVHLFRRLLARTLPGELLTCASTLVLANLSTPTNSPMLDQCTSFVQLCTEVYEEYDTLDEALLLPPWGYAPHPKPIHPPRTPLNTKMKHVAVSLNSTTVPVDSPAQPSNSLSGTTVSPSKRFQCYATRCEAPSCPAHGTSASYLSLSGTSSSSLSFSSAPSSSSLPAYDPPKAVVLPSTMLSGLAPIASPSDDKASFVRPLTLDLAHELPFTVECAIRGLCLFGEGRMLDIFPFKE